jgi:hypothetical protein
MSNSLETLTVDAFQPRVGQTFRIRPRPEHELEAELIEARALGGGPSRAPSEASQRRTPFSLSFRTSLCPAAAEHLRSHAPGNGVVRDLPGTRRTGREGNGLRGDFHR